jgi:HAD superfamily hydrolase (TIGR01509 family)
MAEEFAANGIAIAAGDLADRFAGLSDGDVVAAVERSAGGRALPPDFLTRLEKRAEALFANELRPIPGVTDLLDRLSGRRCVASNSGVRRLASSLKRAGLARYFDKDAVFSADLVARPKPAPDLHRHAAAAMGVAPDRAVVIEDSETGVRAARSAGMTVIGFTGASHVPPHQPDRLRAAGATAVIDRLADFPEAIGMI